MFVDFIIGSSVFVFLAVLFMVPIGHVISSGLRTNSQGPYWLFGVVAFIYLKIEYLVMRLANNFVMGKWSWFFRDRVRRSIFDVIRMMLTGFINLEPYTIEESKAIIKNTFRNTSDKVVIVNRICPCRQASNKILKKNGEPYDDKPIVTDIVFLTRNNHNGLIKSKGAKGFMRFVTIKQVLKLMDKFEEAGLVHAFMGPCPSVYGSALMTVCNCHPNICHPLVWHKKRNYSFFHHGHNIAVLDSDKCTGCGNCIKRCPVNARKLVEGKAIVLDHCFGCGTCRIGCEGNATTMKATCSAQYYPDHMIRNKDGSFIGSKARIN